MCAWPGTINSSPLSPLQSKYFISCEDCINIYFWVLWKTIFNINHSEVTKNPTHCSYSTFTQFIYLKFLFPDL